LVRTCSRWSCAIRKYVDFLLLPVAPLHSICSFATYGFEIWFLCEGLEQFGFVWTGPGINFNQHIINAWVSILRHRGPTGLPSQYLAYQVFTLQGPVRKTWSTHPCYKVLQSVDVQDR
jgi:hypothetical protein